MLNVLYTTITFVIRCKQLGVVVFFSVRVYIECLMCNVACYIDYLLRINMFKTKSWKACVLLHPRLL